MESAAYLHSAALQLPLTFNELHWQMGALSITAISFLWPPTRTLLAVRRRHDTIA